MNSEAFLGFNAFNFGQKNDREIDFIKLRKIYSENLFFSKNIFKNIVSKNIYKKYSDFLNKE